MTMLLADFVNEAPPSGTIGSLDAALKEIDLPSPIDRYIQYSRSILLYGTSIRLSEDHRIGGLLLLGVISAAEGYFRSVLSLSLEVCPICRRNSAEKQINLGGVLWHGQEEFRRSAFEHMSFTSKEELRRAAEGYLKFKLADSHFKIPLEEYEIACHLRHGIVHNAGILPGRNAVQMEVRRYKKVVEIVVDYALLQRTVAAVDTLVLTFNRELFAEICRRWAIDWRQRADWIKENEDKLFTKIWNMFFCSELHGTRAGRSKITKSNCMTEVRNKFGI